MQKLSTYTLKVKNWYQKTETQKVLSRFGNIAILVFDILKFAYDIYSALNGNK